MIFIVILRIKHFPKSDDIREISTGHALLRIFYFNVRRDRVIRLQ